MAFSSCAFLNLETSINIHLGNATIYLRLAALRCKVVREAPKNIDTLTNDFEADAIDLIKYNPALNPDLYSTVFSKDENIEPVHAALLERVRDASSALLKAFENDDGQLPRRVQLGAFRNELARGLCVQDVLETGSPNLSIDSEVAQ